MKKRFCDQCNEEIETGEDYFKVSLQEHKDKRQILTHAGDLCKACWHKNKKIFGGKKK